MTSWSWFRNPKRIDSVYNVTNESCLVTLPAKLYKRRATVAGNCLRKMFRLNWEVCLLQSGLLRTTTPSSKTLRAQHHLCVKLLPALRNLKLYSCNSNWMFVEVCLRWTGTRHAADSLSLAASAAPPYNWGILPFCMVAQIHKFVLLVFSCQKPPGGVTG